MRVDARARPHVSTNGAAAMFNRTSSAAGLEGHVTSAAAGGRGRSTSTEVGGRGARWARPEAGSLRPRGGSLGLEREAHGLKKGKIKSVSGVVWRSLVDLSRENKPYASTRRKARA